jgi:hypothetical protein
VSEYRPIAEFDGYMINPQGTVWSVGRTVATKSGATRTTAAKPLKPDDKNRVALRRDGKTHKINVDHLVAQHFPPTRHHIYERRVTLTCRWCHRDFDDFTTIYCQDAPAIWPDLFRCPYCTTAVTVIPDHFPTTL